MNSGALTSVLGIAVMAFSKRELLRIFFKFFQSIFGLALWNGLAFIPALLVLVGDSRFCQLDDPGKLENEEEMEFLGNNTDEEESPSSSSESPDDGKTEP